MTPEQKFAENEKSRIAMRERYKRDPERVKKQSKQYAQRYPERVAVAHRRRYFLKKYGLTLEQVEQMKTTQEYRCAICSEKKILDVDHCHRTGLVRKMLCSDCNRKLGIVENNRHLLTKMLDYLGAV